MANRIKHLIRVRGEEDSAFGSYLLLDPQRFLTTTLVGNNIVMVACSSLSVLIFRDFVPNSILVFVTTAFLLIFGEIIPKSFAQQVPNRLVRIIPALLQFFYYLFYPFVYLAELLSKIILSFSGEQKNVVTHFFSKRDLPILIREYSSPKTIGLDEKKLITKAIIIGEKRLNDIMVPRTEIVSVSKDTSLKELRKAFISSGFSRLPVYEDTIDNIIGFYYAFDILMQSGPTKKPMRPAFFLPETLKAILALKTLRKKHKSIAIVIDEHGGTAGLVTIEDIVEELFGKISDEFDRERVLSRKTSKHVVIADGRAEIEELREKYGISFPAGDYVTVAGLIEHETGRIPEPGEVIEIDGYKCEIRKADERRILEVKIQIKKKKKKEIWAQKVEWS